MLQSTPFGEHGLSIQGEVTIYTAAELRDVLAERIAAGGELELDLGDVSELDTCGFQVLLQAKRESRESGKELRITAHSTAVREVLQLLNMEKLFGDPLVLPAERNSEVERGA